MKKAFTLIELLVVIAIIAILAGVVLFNLRATRTKAYDSNALQQMKTTQAGAVSCTGDGSLQLTSPVAGNAICSSGNASTVGAWPNLPAGWSYTTGASNFDNGGTTGNFKFTASSGSGATAKSVVCTPTSCDKSGF